MAGNGRLPPARTLLRRDALYGTAKTAHIKVDVTFEDGRKGAIEGDIEIRDLAPHPLLLLDVEVMECAGV